MEERIAGLEKGLEDIRQRNIRVEAEKAWETSWFRKISIAILTYVIASGVLYAIGVSTFYLSATIPTLGYLLSTQSLPFIKNRWMKRYIEAKNS